MAHHHLTDVSQASVKQWLPNAICPTSLPCLLDDTRQTTSFSAGKKQEERSKSVCIR